jgi:hypothetical protein
VARGWTISGIGAPAREAVAAAAAAQEAGMPVGAWVEGALDKVLAVAWSQAKRNSP